MTTYNPAIPQPSNLISNSQAQILGNFAQLNAQFGVDHNPFYTGSTNGNGHHVQVTFDNAPSAPSPTGTVSVVYPQLVGSNQELFFSNASSEYSSTGKTQLTGPSLLNANGYAFLPGGILMKWGRFNGAPGNNTFTFPTGASIPVFSAIYQVFLQPASSGANNYFGYVNSSNTTSFSFDSTSRTNNTAAGGTYAYSYLAIGAF